MTFINYAAREINCKIVYYGPGLCGKTTNLQYIYDRTNPASKGKLISLATETDRTLFFDFLPLDLGTVRGFKTRFHLYTVPGQVFYDASRKLILKGVDGVVFVADSQEARLDANVESLQNLEKNLDRPRLRPAGHSLRPAAQQARPPDGAPRRRALPPAQLQGRAHVRGQRPERAGRLRHAEGGGEAGPDGAAEEVGPARSTQALSSGIAPAESRRDHRGRGTRGGAPPSGGGTRRPCRGDEVAPAFRSLQRGCVVRPRRGRALSGRPSGSCRPRIEDPPGIPCERRPVGAGCSTRALRRRRLEAEPLAQNGGERGLSFRVVARLSAARSRAAFRGERSKCAVSSRLRSSAADTSATSSAPRRRMITASWS